MNARSTLVKKLDEIIRLESNVSIETLGSYIVGELLGNYDGMYTELNETDPMARRIGDLASDLEIANGSEMELSSMWSEIKRLTEELRQS